MARFETALESVPCDLCGRVDEEFLYLKPGVLSGYPFRVVRCRFCGLLYLNPRLNEVAIGRLYDRAYYNGNGFDDHVNYLLDYDRKSDDEKIFPRLATVRFLEELVLPPAALLDYGCGAGDLMRQAEQSGYRVEGFEISDFAAQFARSLGFRVYQDVADLPAEQYDIVTAIEVLEHCVSPTKALQVIYRALKPGGVFYYTTENFDGFYEGWRGGNPDPVLEAYVKPEGHIYFFSSRVMEAYFHKVGFTQVFRAESTMYDKDARVFKMLSRLRLIDSRAEKPQKVWERILYYGGQKLVRIIKQRKKPLPFARK